MIYGILMLKITQLTVQSMRIQVNKSIQGKFDEYALTDSGLGLGTCGGHTKQSMPLVTSITL